MLTAFETFVLCHVIKYEWGFLNLFIFLFQAIGGPCKYLSSSCAFPDSCSNPLCLPLRMEWRFLLFPLHSLYCVICCSDSYTVTCSKFSGCLYFFCF